MFSTHFQMQSLESRTLFSASPLDPGSDTWQPPSFQSSLEVKSPANTTVDSKGGRDAPSRSMIGEHYEIPGGNQTA